MSRNQISFVKKRENLVFFSLCLLILVIDELWLNRRLTSCGKKMNSVDTIRLREETTVISCFEYESVHDQNHPKRKIKERRREGKRFPPSKSHFTIGRSHIYIYLLKKNNFYFENRFDILSVKKKKKNYQIFIFLTNNILEYLSWG
jgi:hypothetical protein